MRIETNEDLKIILNGLFMRGIIERRLIQEINRLELSICQMSMAVATDGKTLYWNPDELNKLGFWEIEYALIHEGWHLLLEHPRWYWLIPEEFGTLFKLACDLRVNDIMINTGQWRMVAEDIPIPERGKFKNFLSGYGTFRYLILLFYQDARTDEEKARFSDFIEKIADVSHNHPPESEKADPTATSGRPPG